ncbi:MAG: flippase-like domain-containing protein, partial [Candidatus Omnitrophica bacterium]|nr:flippase-like domain-containing protein [Candidatus Omnitrophota bacterium]
VRLSVIDLAKINFQTQFYGLLLPGVLSGGVVKWHKLSKQNKMRAQAAVCIVLSRTMHILSLAILGVGFFLFEMPHHSTQILPVMALGLVVAVLFYAAIMNTTISGAVEKFLNKLFFCRFPESIRTRINKLWGAVKSFHEIRFLTANYTLLLSFLFHLVRTISVYLVMRGLHVDISIISVVWITAVVMFVQLLPISISGLGVREGMFVFLLGKYGIPSSDAMAVSFTIFGFLVIVALIGGIFEAHEFLFQKKREEAPD